MATTLQTPLTLIREEIDGKLYYYKGYKEVLSGEKQSEDIMGSSDLQSYLIALILRRLFTLLPETEYLIQTGEPGLNLGPNDNLANDITIRRTKDSSIDSHSTYYSNKPPIVVLEIDVRVDTNNTSDLDYVLTKTGKLLSFGVGQVVWILTASRRIVVASQANPSLTPYEWKQDIVLLDNCVMNLENWVGQGAFRV